MRILVKQHVGRIIENLGQFQNKDVEITDDGIELGYEEIPPEHNNRDTTLQMKNHLGYVNDLNKRTKKVHLAGKLVGSTVSLTIKYLVE